MQPDFRELAEKWQRRWEEAKIFEAHPDPSRAKCFVTFPFPYMSGPLHVGHGYTGSRVDAYARYKRMKGFNVLFPWAWHWTGETVAGASERIKKKDEKFIRSLREADGVPEAELEKFIEPAYMARYYTDYNRVAVKRLGLSVDWRREFHTTSLHPTFSRFIEWQYERLREGGYVAKGTHPVVWCPHCESPTGEADRLEGGGIMPEEYTLIKFPFDGAFLVAATFRPETIFGVTNLWINPEGEYVEAGVGGERWIISKVAASKLKEQLRTPTILREFKGRELIGRRCQSPMDGRSLPVLPGWFVKVESASGVVYSVPAHAPYDYIALKDLASRPQLLEEWGLTPAEIDSIKPISIIRVEDFGEFPAIEAVEKLGVKDQHDPKAEEATKLVYKKEFHRGVLKENCDGYAGQPISKVKEGLVADLKGKRIADVMFDLAQPVVCRCTTPNFVKIIQDQWFLHYSDPDWKARAREVLARMEVHPPEARRWFEEVINWLHDWACARKTGLGTPLPWAKDWIVETLSDSTIYTSFYTVSQTIRALGLTPLQLTDALFDYVFLGRGDSDVVAKGAGVERGVVEALRAEFLYWYPVDLRNSGKDLVSNHLTFFIFHHAAIFPPAHWPKSIAVNGFMRVEGEEMHKSKGNFIPLRKAVEYGADVTRAVVLLAAEDMDDPDWRWESLEEVKTNLTALHAFILSLAKVEGAGEGGEPGPLEKWLGSVLQKHVKKVEDNLALLKTRTAFEDAFYGVWNNLRWYRRRYEKPHPETLKEAVSIWVRLMAPFIPHLSEELWELMREKEFISLAPWPIYDTGKINPAAEESEGLISSTLEDVRSIIKAIGLKPKKIHIYSASSWKWDLYLEILSEVARADEKGTTSPTPNELMKTFLKRREVREKMKNPEKLVKGLIDQALLLAPEVRKRRRSTGRLGEVEILRQGTPFLKHAVKFEIARDILGKRTPPQDEFDKETDIEIIVYEEGEEGLYDPKTRAPNALPYRPALYIE